MRIPKCSVNGSLAGVLVVVLLLATAFFASIWINVKIANAHEIERPPVMSWRLGVATFEGHLYTPIRSVQGVGPQDQPVYGIIFTSQNNGDLMLLTGKLGHKPWSWLVIKKKSDDGELYYSPENYDILDLDCDGIYEIHRHGEEMKGQLSVPTCLTPEGG